MKTIDAKEFSAAPMNVGQTAKSFSTKKYFGSVVSVAFAAGILIWAISIYENKQTSAAWFCLPIAVSAACLLNGWLIASRWKIFARWFGLALVGQAASLQMIDAGRLIHFQHYRVFADLFAQQKAATGFLILQIILVTVGISRILPSVKVWLNKIFNRAALIFAVFFLCLAGAAVTPDAGIYLTSLLFAAVVQFIAIGNIVLAVRAVPFSEIKKIGAFTRKILGGAETGSQIKTDKFSLIVALFILTLSAFLSFFVYQAHPHVPDEVQYIFQARYFAAGQVSVAAPQVPEAFAMYMIPQTEARWFAIFPPGWAALLAVGIKFGVVWLVNPLLAAVCVLLAYLFLREIYPLRTARTAIILLACSPWFIFTAMSLMSHVAALDCALGAAVLWQRGVKKQTFLPILAAGMLIGFLSLIRPLDAAIGAAALGIVTLYFVGNLQRKIIGAAVLGGGAFISAGLILPYNRAVTGEAFLSPMDFYYTKYFWAGVNSIGFGANRGIHWSLDAFPGHSPLEAVVNAALNIFQTNTELFGWATGSLALIIFYLIAAARQREDFWAWSLIALIVGAYSLFWYHGGPDFGARYWFLMIVPLCALAARGIEYFASRFNRNRNDDPRIYLAAAMLCGLTLFNYLPWRALDKYYHYLEMQPGIVELAREKNFGRSLVIIRGTNHPDFQSAWIYNPLDSNANAPLYAFDESLQNSARLWNVYADRPLWIVDGPTLTGDGYQVAEGPLYADENASAAKSDSQ